MAATPIIDYRSIPEGAIWCIGQHSPAERRDLERRTRRGEFVKVRAYWMHLALKMVFVPVQ